MSKSWRDRFQYWGKNFFIYFYFYFSVGLGRSPVHRSKHSSRSRPNKKWNVPWLTCTLLALSSSTVFFLLEFSSTAFARQGMKTITTVDRTNQHLIDTYNRISGFSEIDIKQINLMYGCSTYTVLISFAFAFLQFYTRINRNENCFLFENFFPDCLCKVVRRRFGLFA